jgi:hypothetical protein
MKITLTSTSGAAFPCTEPYVGAPSVVVTGATCPVCHGKVGLVDGRGVLRALAGPGNVGTARAGVESDYGPCALQDAPERTGDPFRVRAPSLTRGHGHVEGPAECYRCRSVVGVLRVDFDTMWGLDEDERVLHGRCRVY